MALFTIVWPGLLLVSAYAVVGAIRFYRSVHRSAPGQLVLLTVVGWVLSLIGVALVGSFYLAAAPEDAAPVMLPVFILWAGSMLTIVWVIQHWGREAVNLESYYLELEQMDKMKSQFINNVAHELNTPITPLKLQLGILKSGNLGELNTRQQASLQAIDRNVDRLAVLVEQVLLASMVQSGRLPMDFTRIPLRSLVEEAVKEAQRLPERTGANVEIGVAEDLLADCDRERMRYVMVHTLAQALRDTTEGGRVRITAESRSADVIVRVRDEGASAAQMERAFRPFTDSFEPWTSERGLGLELFIARGIVERHGGRMWIESSGPDGAAVLAFSLPRRTVRVTV